MEKRISHTPDKYPTPSADRAARTLGSLEQTGIGIWEYNLLTDEVHINENWANLLGYTREELSPLTITAWQQKVHPEDLENSRKEKQRYLEGSTRYYKCTVRMQHKQGYWIWIEARGAIVSKTPEGRPEWICGTHRDISAQTISETKYTELFKTSPAMVALTDLETLKMVEVNPAFCQTLKLEYDEVIDSKTDTMLGIEPRISAAVMEKMKKEGRLRNQELTVFTGDKRQIEVLMSSDIIEISNIPYIYTTAIDISHQKEVERNLQQALAEEKLLLEELNHRVKNNLMMVGSLISLKNAELGETADLSDLLSRVQAITSLHQQLQDSEGVNSIPLGPYIRQVIFAAVQNLNRKIEITFNVTDLNIDTRRAVTLGLIVNELATNAAKHGFAEIDDPKIHIEISQQDNSYLLVFSNNGSPIDEHIDFAQGETLGLRLISTLVHQIEGNFSVEREPHPVFTLSIPVESK